MTVRWPAKRGSTAAAGGAEVNDLSAAVTWANIPIANVPTGVTGAECSLGNHVHEGTAIDATAVTDGYVLTADGAGNSAWEAVSAGAEVNDLSAAVTWANIPIANVPTGTTSVTVALGDHVHEGTAIDATAVTDGYVLTADGAGNAAWEAAASGAVEQLNYGAEVRLITAAGGDLDLRGSDSVLGSSRALRYSYADGTIAGEVYQVGGNMYMSNYMLSGNVALQATKAAGGAPVSPVLCDPDSAVTLQYAGVSKFTTTADGIRVNGGSVRIPAITSITPTTNEGAFWVRDTGNTTLAYYSSEGSANMYTLQNTISEMAYTFDTSTTAADPGQGDFRLNGASYGATTTMYVSSWNRAMPYTGSTSTGNNNDWAWNTAQVGDLVTARSVYDPRRFFQALITSNTDNGNWHTIGLNILTSGSLFQLTTDEVRFHIQYLSRAAGTGTQAADDVVVTGEWSVPAVARNNTASSGIVLIDAGQLVRFTGATASKVCTIPANADIAFPIGTMIGITNDGSVTMTLAITTDTMTWGKDNTTGTRTLAAGADCVILKTTATTWKVNGSALVT
jgi:hypothetical protein